MNEPSMMTEDLVPVKSVPTKYGDIKFYCAGRVGLYRADTFHTKEPETLEWIDTFQPGDTLWDIGANVGCYTLYAAVKGIKVLAFEPSAFNYFLLMKNLMINRLDKKVEAYCLALSNNASLSAFNMNYLEVGDSCHQLAPIGDISTARLRQSVITLSVDDLVRNFNPTFPNHIKIDVDGVEAAIILGAMKTLSDSRLKSVLIEIDDANPEDLNIIHMLKFAGLELTSRRHAPQYENSTMWNCVFTRVENV